MRFSRRVVIHLLILCFLGPAAMFYCRRLKVSADLSDAKPGFP